MATDTANTRTKERVESRVETVEVTEYQCANCRQWFSGESDIVPVALNAEADTPADADEVAALCDGCAEAVFGYEGDSDASIEPLRQAVFPFQDEEAIKSIQSKLVSVSITLTVAGIVLWVGMQVMNKAAQAGTAEFEQASRDIVTNAEPAFGAMGVVTVALIVVATFLAMPLLPRRM